MHSALLLVDDSARSDVERAHQGLVRSLAALVPALLRDGLREAVIVGAPGLGLEKIADHAGCALVVATDRAGALAAALKAARSERVFLLRAGFAPTHGFIDELVDLALSDAAYALRLEPVGLAQRLAPNLAPAVGLSARRQACLAKGFVDCAQGARLLRAKTLKARARDLGS